MFNNIFYLVALLLVIYIVYRVFKWGIRKNQERIIMKKMSKSGIRFIDKMDGHQFEIYLKALFHELGYKSEVTKQSCDFGVDLVFKGKNRIVIQAKRYGIKNRVGIKAVQEIYAGKTYYKGDEAWVITNSFYTKQAEELAKACNVKLINRLELLELINKVNPEQKAEDIYKDVEPKGRKCPLCKQELVVRTSKKNGEKFFGCSQFPSCKHTEPINK
nr:restriction endonuclease [Bacillus pseudomycoides]